MARLLELNGIPLFDIGTVLSGASVGFSKAKGIEIGHLDELLKYGPTVFATLTVPSAMLYSRKRFNYDSNIFEITPGQGLKVYNDPVLTEINKKLSTPNIVKETFGTSLKTAIETCIGYAAGYAIGRFS